MEEPRYKTYKNFENKSDIFRLCTEEDIKRVDKYFKDLKSQGIPVQGIKQRGGGCLDTYDSSQINPTENKDSITLPYNYDKSGLFIGRSFDLLFSSGILEFERTKRKFDFLFSYETSNRLEEEVLLRLGLAHVHEGSDSVDYRVKVYPAGITEVKKAYKEIEKVDRGLKIAPVISRKINDLLKRR